MLKFIRVFDNKEITLTKVGDRYQLDNYPVYYSEAAISACIYFKNWIKV